MKITLANFHPCLADFFCSVNGVLVTSAKLLGMTISHDLKWNMHSSELIRKCSSRLYFLRQLKRSGVAPSKLVQFYVTCIRPVLEYASPVFHRSLPNYISEDLERIQRRAFRIIYPDLSYSVALETVGLPKLHERREKISINLFDEIVCNLTHSLHSLLPQRKTCKYALRRKKDFTLPRCKTERLKNLSCPSSILSQREVVWCVSIRTLMRRVYINPVFSRFGTPNLLLPAKPCPFG